MNKFVTLIVLALISSNVFAGGIKGVVTDAKNNTTLIGVVVFINGTAKGTATDIDGKYELLGLDDGTYEVTFTYTNYTTNKQTVTIAGNQDVALDVKMTGETTELKGHVIKSGKVTNTENSVINEIKSSSNVVSGISAAQITKTMDRNAADVVKRVPGVTIQDGRFIIVRGLPDRYNNVWLNDASTPSSEADKKAFSFDILPSGLIDRVLVFKTPSADLPGDFAGGMVKVYTTSIADKNQVSVSLQTSSREFTTGSKFNYEAPSSTDVLGYDDGKRNIPKNFPGVLSTKTPDYKTNIAAWSKSFGNDWIISSTKANPDARFSLALSNVVKIRKIKLGNTLGVNYSNTYTNFNIHRQLWDSLSKNYNYNDQRSTNNVMASIMDNIGISVGNTKIEFKNLYTQVGTSSLLARQNIKDTSININDERSYSIGYDSRATYAAQLTGTHKNDADTRKYTWTLGYTDLFKNQPNLRRIKYTKDPSLSDSFYRAAIPSSVDILNGGRWYSALYEHTYSFSHQFTQKISVTKDYSFDVSAGNYLEYKSRSFNIRELGYTIKTGALTQTILKMPINEIFNDSNIDGNKRFKIAENTQGYDHYDGKNELLASFLSIKAPVGKHFNVVGGARYEYNVQTLKAVANLDTIKPEIKTKFLLPSINATYSFSDKSIVRAAYGKTLNRPEFREWAPTFYYDFDELAGNYGSLYPNTAFKNKSTDTLKVAQIQNFDLRYEYYPAPGDMVQAGLFYKSFKDPIQRVIVIFGDLDYTYINANTAYCYGFELDFRKNLEWVDKKIGTKFLKDFSLIGNLSLVKSQVTIDTAQINQVMPHAPLQGQSPYIVNAGLFYQNADNGFQGSLLYNVSGPRIFVIGNFNPGSQSFGEMPFQSFDFIVSKTFHKHYLLNFGIQNILGSRVVFMEDINKDNKFDTKHDREVRTYYPGRYYTLGIKIKF